MGVSRSPRDDLDIEVGGPACEQHLIQSGLERQAALAWAVWKYVDEQKRAGKFNLGPMLQRMFKSRASLYRRAAEPRRQGRLLRVAARWQAFPRRGQDLLGGPKEGQGQDLCAGWLPAGPSLHAGAR